MKRSFTIPAAFVAGAFMALWLRGLPASAFQLSYWTKDQVSAVVLVEPTVGGFAPAHGSKLGNLWPKEKVVPVLVVKPKPLLNAFVPENGSSIGNFWSREQVKATVLVQPVPEGFIPAAGDCTALAPGHTGSDN